MKRGYRLKADASHLKKLVDEGVSTGTLAEDFGVHKAAVAAWIRLDSAPFWTLCACEGARRRHGVGYTELIFCEVPKHAAEALITIIKSLSGQVHATRIL